MTDRVIDLTGQTFGSLIALNLSHIGRNNTAYWLYQCRCGKQHIARGNTIKHQAKKGDLELPSCGCIELKRKTKHGFRKVLNTHRAYAAYVGMMQRCYDPNNEGYGWYGAIGVTVCSEWKNNPEAFVDWSISHGWEKGLHIDKDILCKQLGISPHVYSPATCQWVSAKVNVGFATNRDNFGKHPNVKLSHAEVAEILHLYFSSQVTSQSELARMFNVTPSSIARLIRLSRERAV